MATGQDLVNVTLELFRTHLPWYSQAGDRCHPEWTGHCDCSGLLCWAQNKVGIPYPCTNSWEMAKQGHREWLGISVEEAFHTPGAWLIQGANQGQTNINNHGHIGMSAGDGHHTLEARGRYAGVGVFWLSSLRWDYAMIPPGINRVSAAPPPKPIPKPKDNPMGMLVLPNTKTTPIGRGATARADTKHNRVALEDGARLVGDHASDAGKSERWWAPPADAAIPGWTIVDVAAIPGGVFSKYPKKILVRYAWGEDNGGTYIADVISK